MHVNRFTDKIKIQFPMLKIDPSSESLYSCNPCYLNDSNQSHEAENSSASAIQCGWSSILDKLHNFSKPKQKKYWITSTESKLSHCNGIIETVNEIRLTTHCYCSGLLFMASSIDLQDLYHVETNQSSQRRSLWHISWAPNSRPNSNGLNW